MTDVFVGNWMLSVELSAFDPKYVPASGKVQFELDSDGSYRMLAEGVNSAGETVAERPQKFIPDGREHSDPGIPGLTTIATRLDPNTLAFEGRMNGKVVGQGTYSVSSDGGTLTATMAGTGVNGPFETRVVFIRQ